MLHPNSRLLLAVALSALAGYVDGIGFLHLGGLFVSFMSGNSTRMGVSLADGGLARGRGGARARCVVRDRAGLGSLIAAAPSGSRGCWSRRRCFWRRSPACELL